MGAIPDVLTPHSGTHPKGGPRRGGLAVAGAPPQARFVSRAGEEAIYAARASRVAVRGAGGEVVAVIEIVSPGNKSTRHAIRSFAAKSVDPLGRGVHLLVVDPFPPTPRDPNGLHPLVWEELRDEPFALPPDKPLTLAAYCAGPPPTAYVEPVAVGDPLPDMPLFLDADTYVRAPLETAYHETWARCPREFREAVAGATPG